VTIHHKWVEGKKKKKNYQQRRGNGPRQPRTRLTTKKGEGKREVFRGETKEGDPELFVGKSKKEYSIIPLRKRETPEKLQRKQGQATGQERGGPSTSPAGRGARAE